jgi:hypothetical protein
MAISWKSEDRDGALDPAAIMSKRRRHNLVFAIMIAMTIASDVRDARDVCCL